MIPINEYISIILLPEPEQILLTEREPLIPAKVVDVSPDINVPFTAGAEIFILRGRQVPLGGKLFIHVEHTVLWKI